MTHSRRNHALPLVAALAAACTSACIDEFVADDVSFDQWCGETLCHWEVDLGEIEKIGTWHPSDSGVQLVGSEAQISQLQESFQGDCIEFELIANVEARTRTTLQLDFNADGTVDLVQALPTDPWKPEVFVVRTPARYHGVRFILHKAAKGRAVIAQMGASDLSGSECAGAPLDLIPQNTGAACVRDEDCAEGLCAAGTCSECATDEDCFGDEVCALVDEPRSEQRGCVAPVEP